MKKALLFLAAILVAYICFGQDPEVQAIIKKLQSGQQITQAEQAKLKQWAEKMSQQNAGAENKQKSPLSAESSGTGTSGNICPKPAKTIPAIAPLTREGYITLAKALMTTYGPKVGDKLPEIKQLLERTSKPSEGADMGALFLMAGSGSLTIYCAAWSAVRLPEDILTANTLGVALKDMGEYVKALQVLKYADKLRPGVPLLSINMGWVCYEMGDPASAKKMFNQALLQDPDLTSPHLGLGMIAECAGDHITAENQLRIALANNYSVAGFAAYKKSKAAQSEGQGNDQGGEGNQDAPLQDEKGNSEGFEIPDLPDLSQPARMTQQEMPLRSYTNRLDSRIAQLFEEFQSVSQTVSAQAVRASQNPEGSIVFVRDFATERMMYEDVVDILFGPNSNFSKAMNEGSANCGRTADQMTNDAEATNQDLEKTIRLQKEMNACTEQYIEAMKACGPNDPCLKKAEDDYHACFEPLKAEQEQVMFRICKRTKSDLDLQIGCQQKLYSQSNSAFRSAASDLYAFTEPILAKIYSPSYNEMFNIWRELTVLTFQRSLAGIGLGIASEAKGYQDMKCIEPEPPDPPQEVEEPTLPKKKNDDCPLGDGLRGGYGAFSAELTCDHVTISGGEGILGSVTRDFKKHETKLWIGAGAKVEYGHGNLTGEATVGVEVVIGNNNTVNDVTLTSSVKTGLGGLVEAEISGRISVEGGPAINTTVGITPPAIPGL
jgi:tetratricopeptide (TPR) repeat protein